MVKYLYFIHCGEKVLKYRNIKSIVNVEIYIPAYKVQASCHNQHMHLIYKCNIGVMKSKKSIHYACTQYHKHHL